MWWEGTYQAVTCFYHGPLLMLCCRFPLSSLYLQTQQGLPGSWELLFVTPLLTKVASVRPEKEHAGTPALPLWQLLWVLSKDSGTEDKKGH